MILSIEHFDAFHELVHGSRPFEWQNRLLRQIVEERRWPRVLDLPTAVGKTTCIDIALFALALDAARPSAERWCPRRIAMVVDRRVIVDQVGERGRKLLRILVKGGDEGIVGEVGRRLRSLSRKSEDPVGVFTLRGGIAKDDGWARTPDQPLILASTVDQLGSRLLVQGYGVSLSMKPVHAGLLANDTLVLLDEVHLSEPFAETLDALERLRERLVTEHSETGGKAVLPRRFQHAFLSATPRKASKTSFVLTAKEKANTADNPLARRLNAIKPASLVKVRDRDVLCSKCIEVVRDQLTRHDLVAVIVNRVRSAQEIVGALRDQHSNPPEVILLTGRMRPLDRDDIMRGLRSRIEAGRKRTSPSPKLVVVGTQCIEAGADFDFDALVTESASLDALKQRFGRLDRLGEYQKAEAVIIHVDVTQDDPVYGMASAKTFKWLQRLAKKKSKTVNFGSLALPSLKNDEGDLLAPHKSAPTLLPAYMDLWMQTSPPPSVGPCVSLWLHGPESGPADVQIVWRCDLTENDLDDGNDEKPVDIVASLRPSSLESVSVPFITAGRWLAGASDDIAMVADVEISRADGDGWAESSNGGRAVRWSGRKSEVIEAKKLRPGDTIVVPAMRGGLSDKTFDPSAKEPVEDLAERATLFARGRPLLRLHPEVLRTWGLSVPTDDLGEARSMLERLADAEPRGWRKLWLQRLARSSRTIIINADDPWNVLEGRRVSVRELREVVGAEGERDDAAPIEAGVELTTDDEDSFCAGHHVELSVHSEDVERLGREFASNLGFATTLVEDVALAGWLHDVGKADRRFQIMLRGGSEIDFLADETSWAKSGIPSDARAALRAAQSRSGYPKDARHEVQSLAMMERCRELVGKHAHDLDLVLHLVASHHGYCRPFAPAVVDEDPVDVVLRHTGKVFGTLAFEPTASDNRMYRLDSSVADRFWRLVQRYGWLELCWLEAVLRLADHRASEMEQQEG